MYGFSAHEQCSIRFRFADSGRRAGPVNAVTCQNLGPVSRDPGIAIPGSQLTVLARLSCNGQNGSLFLFSKTFTEHYKKEIKYIIGLHTHTHTHPDTRGWLMDPPWVLVMLQYFEKISPLVESL